MKKPGKYTYDMWHYFSKLNSRGGGTGGTYLVGIRKTHKSFTIKYPDDTHLIIRKPDNKLMNFYHPFEKIEGISQ